MTSSLQSRLFVATLCSLCVVGCKREGPSELPLCKAEVAGSEAEEVSAGSVTPDIWFLILLRNFDRNTMTLKTPGQDCSGRMIEPQGEAVDACIAESQTASKLPERPLTEDDLLIAPLEDGRQLAWAKVGEFDNGEAIGPIAITEWTSRGVAVRALGTLRAHKDRASMRLESVGGDQMLVVESRACDPDDPKACSRRVRLLPLIGDAFSDRRMQTENGTCLGPAEVTQFEESTVTLDNGIERTFEVARTVDFGDTGIVINEQVTIKDKDPAQPELPAKLFRRANLERPLQVSTEAIITKAGLWDDMMAQHGSVAVKAPAE